MDSVGITAFIGVHSGCIRFAGQPPSMSRPLFREFEPNDIPVQPILPVTRLPTRLNRAVRPTRPLPPKAFERGHPKTGFVVRSTVLDLKKHGFHERRK
jgi:hypothetical protein